MTKEQLAKLLNGRTYGDEITEENEADAAESGLIVIFGASDDLVEFRGAIHDEIDAYGGKMFWLSRTRTIEDHEECDCEYCGYLKARDSALEIKALWCEGDFSWEFVTKAPHATFEIYENVEKYCRGIVLHLDDIQPK